MAGSLLLEFSYKSFLSYYSQPATHHPQPAVNFFDIQQQILYASLIKERSYPSSVCFIYKNKETYARRFQALDMETS